MSTISPDVSSPDANLTRQQVMRRLGGSTIAGAVLALGLAILLAPDAIIAWFIAAAVGLAIGLAVARIVWRKDLERFNISGFGSPRSW